MGVSKFSPASQRGVDATPTASSTNLVESGGVKSALNAVDESIAIRVSGNKTTYASGAAIGQYVIVDGSTITGITDGLYKAAKAIPYNTGIDSTYLTAVSGGGLNELKAALTTNTISTGTTGLYAKKCVNMVMLTSGDTSRVTADANKTIWTLPASLRPLEYVELLNVVNQERLVITPTGMIRSTVALDNVFLRFTVTYLTYAEPNVE